MGGGGLLLTACDRLAFGAPDALGRYARPDEGPGAPHRAGRFHALMHRGQLEGVDNLATSSAGVAYVAEDGDDMQVVLVRPDGSTFPVLRLPGMSGSEITGLAFDPSGSRLYFSSQRNPGRTYEVIGPWNTYAFPGTLSR